MRTTIAAALLAGLLATPALAQAPDAATRLAQSGMLGSLLDAIGGQNIKEIADSHKDLTPAQRTAVEASGRKGLAEITQTLKVGEAKAFAAAMTPADLAAAADFFDGPAGRAYKAAFPRVLMAMAQTPAANDVKGQLEARICRETQVCPKPMAMKK